MCTTLTPEGNIGDIPDKRKTRSIPGREEPEDVGASESTSDITMQMFGGGGIPGQIANSAREGWNPKSNQKIY